MIDLDMESTTLRFAATARLLTDAARHRGYVAPTFRSPPRVRDRMRTIRHHANGSATVSLALRGRPWPAVVADMIEGFVVVNECRAGAAEELRDVLWSVVEEIDGRGHDQPAAPVAELAPAGTEPMLRVVDAA